MYSGGDDSYSRPTTLTIVLMVYRFIIMSTGLMGLHYISLQFSSVLMTWLYVVSTLFSILIACQETVDVNEDQQPCVSLTTILLCTCSSRSSTLENLHKNP